MSDAWELIKVNHINAIMDGHEATISHFRDRFDCQLNQTMPDRGDGTDACLMTLGGVMFDFFAPKERGERGQGALLARYGDHYVGIEYQVPDVAAARQVCEERGVRVINDLDTFFFTYPGSTFGISWELWDGDWHAPHPDNPRFTAVHPPSYWRDEHPMGLDGLARVSVAVRDVDAAVGRLQDLTDAPIVDKPSRPAAAARGVALQVGDAVFELLEPTGEGALGAYLDRYGERIRSTVFRATDLDGVERFLAARGFDVTPGDADGTIAVPPQQNKNLMFEFTE
jgi:hypothetical protein